MSTTRTPHMTDYEAERQHFHLEVPEYFNFATDVIGKWASDPHKLAMLWVGPRAKNAASPTRTSPSTPAAPPMPLPHWALKKAIGYWLCCHVFPNGGRAYLD